MLSGPPGIVVNPVSGLVQWTPSVANIGTHRIVIEADNTVGSSSLNIDITISSDVPQLSVEFNPTTDGSRYAVAETRFTAQVNDVSNTPPAYALITAPSGMAIDATSGLITWLPGLSQEGATNVTVRPTSSAGSTDLSFTFYTYFTGPVSKIQVTNLTALHPTASWAPPIGAGADLLQGYTVIAIAKYRYGRSNRTEKITYDSPGSGTQFQLTGLTTGRKYKLSINAYDADGNCGLVNPNTVEFAPRPALPNLSWTVSSGSGNRSIVAGQPVVVQLTDTNATSSQSTFSIVNAPSGLVLDSVTGEVRWSTSATDIGPVPVTLRATNTVGSKDVTININVLFSGPVRSAGATRVSGSTAASAGWLPPSDKVGPVASYKVAMHWTWSGRKRSRSMTAPGTRIDFSLIPTGAVSHKGVTITPVDAWGRLGAPTPLIAYGTIAAPPPTNVSPVANAGPDQAIALPHTAVTLNGSTTDDGLPNPPGRLTYSWNVVSAPGSVTFGNAGAANTTASFSGEGMYTLRLTLSDGELSHQDDVIVAVNPAPQPVNAPPVAYAGLDRVMTLPDNTVTLNGSATDDGLPATPGGLLLNWKVVSGSGIVTFGDAGIATTTASFSVGGTYTLLLAVSDGVHTDTDTSVITVNPEPMTSGPQPFNPNGPKIELQGTIQEVGLNYIVVAGVKIWYAVDTVIKFDGDGDGNTFGIDQPVELTSSRNPDGSATAKKIQIGG